MLLNNNELLKINGGVTNASWLNAVARILSTVIELGRMIGSSIRRGSSKNFC